MRATTKLRARKRASTSVETVSGEAEARVRARRATMADAMWAARLARTCYPDYDLTAVGAWVVSHVNDPKLCFCRTENTLAIAGVSHKFWTPNVAEGYLIALFGERNHPWEAMGCLRFCAKWAKSQKADRFFISSETSHDLSTFAKRLGPVETFTNQIVRI